MNLLAKVTPWPWKKERSSTWGVVAYTNGALYRRIASCGSPKSYAAPEIDAQDEAHATLFQLAPDHALLLAAYSRRSAWIEEREEDCATLRVGYKETGGRAMSERCDIDPFGCPILTPELRAALRKALGLTGTEAEPVTG